MSFDENVHTVLLCLFWFVVVVVVVVKCSFLKGESNDKWAKKPPKCIETSGYVCCRSVRPSP